MPNPSRKRKTQRLCHHPCHHQCSNQPFGCHPPNYLRLKKIDYKFHGMTSLPKPPSNIMLPEFVFADTTEILITPVSKTLKPKKSKKPDSLRDYREQCERFSQGQPMCWDDAPQNKTKIAKTARRLTFIAWKLCTIHHIVYRHGATTWANMGATCSCCHARCASSRGVTGSHLTGTQIVYKELNAWQNHSHASK